MRILLALAALCATGIAHSADPTDEELKKASLALDFCAGIVAADSSEFEAVAARIPGLTLGPRKPLIQQATDDRIREMFRDILKIGDEDELQFAAFHAEPSPRTFPFAVFQPKADICIVVGPPGKPGAAALATMLSAPDSPWTRKTNDDKELWRKPAPFAETIMLGLASNESLIIVALEQRPVATAAEISSITTAAITPCIEGALSEKPPAPEVFEPVFAVTERANSKEAPEVILTTLRSQVAGPRSMLNFNRYRETLYCELWTSDIRQPTANVLAAVISAVEALPGLKPGKSEAPVLQSWRVSRRGAARKASIRVSIEREKIVVVSIEPESGWRW